MALCTLLNAFFALLPRTKTTAMMRPAMAATMSPYSTAVAPSSSLNNLIAFFNMVGLLRCHKSERPSSGALHAVQNTRNSYSALLTAIDVPAGTFNRFWNEDPIVRIAQGGGVGR